MRLIPPARALSISIAEAATARTVVVAKAEPSGGRFRGPEKERTDSAPGHRGEGLREQAGLQFERSGRLQTELRRCQADSRPPVRSEARLQGIGGREAGLRGIGGREAALHGIGAGEADLERVETLVCGLRTDEHSTRLACVATAPTRLSADNIRGRANPLDAVCDLGGSRLVSVSGDIPADTPITLSAVVRFATARHSDVDLPAASRARNHRGPDRDATLADYTCSPTAQSPANCTGGSDTQIVNVKVIVRFTAHSSPLTVSSNTATLITASRVGRVSPRAARTGGRTDDMWAAPSLCAGHIGGTGGPLVAVRE
jgi:hypothetical protein